MLILRPNGLTALTNSSSRDCTSSTLRATRAPSTTNSISRTTFVNVLLLALSCTTLSKSASFLVWTNTFSEVSLNAISSIADKYSEKSVGANTHPCFTLLLTENSLNTEPVIAILAYIPVWSALTRLANSLWSHTSWVPAEVLFAIQCRRLYWSLWRLHKVACSVRYTFLGPVLSRNHVPRAFYF